MGMQCAICGKKPVSGNQYARRGKAKYLGGVGRKVTGISKRTFKPNLQRIQIEPRAAPSTHAASACSASAAAASSGRRSGSRSRCRPICSRPDDAMSLTPRKSAGSPTWPGWS